jgi:outer membrane protein TolC
VIQLILLTLAQAPAPVKPSAPPQLVASGPVSIPPAPTLQEAVDRAAAQNPDVAIARLRIVEAEAVAGAARARHLPQLSGAVSQTYQTTNLQGVGLIFPGFPSRVGPFRVFNARPTLTQTLFDAGLAESIRASRVEAERNRHDLDAVRESVQATVIDLYLRALQGSSRVVASRARLETARAALVQAQQKEAAGAASKLDVARAEQQFQTEDAFLVQIERDYRALKVSLARTIGMEDDIVADLPALPAERFSVMLAELAPAFAQTKTALAERPEAKSDQAAIRRAETDVKAARRAYLPKVEFAGDFGAFGQDPANSLSTYSVGVNATFPIWTSGRIEKEISAAKAREQQAREQARRTRLNIEEQARQAVVEWQAAREANEAARKAAAAARESLALARLRFEGGLSTNLDTINAQQQLAEAEDFEIRVRHDILRAQAAYARARGNVRAFLQ